MFQFPSFPTHDYVFTMGCWRMNANALPHLRDPRVTACLATTRGFSQLYHVFHQL